MGVEEQLSRTVKIELDEGRADSIEGANRIALTHVLQVVLGAGVAKSRTKQAAALTAVNSGRRAFLGGVNVRIYEEDSPATVGWAAGDSLAGAVSQLGGEVVTELDSGLPTIIIGDADEYQAFDSVVMLTWEGWSAGYVLDAGRRLGEAAEFELAGVFSAGLAVAAAFRHTRGDPVAMGEEQGMSLWNYDGDWRDDDGRGPSCSFLPSKMWILGLGHLGQAYAWSLGLLSYADRRDVRVVLQDFDIVSEANWSTGLLLDGNDVGRVKTRVVAAKLEELGFQTRIVERPFDEYTRRTGDEPRLALAGFDDPHARRCLDAANFDYVMDAGLGSGPEHYDEIQVHTFPSSLTSAEAFVSGTGERPPVDQPAYQALKAELIANGTAVGDAQCGVLEVASTTVAASFVGAVASAIVLAEVLKILCQGARTEVLDISVREITHRVAVLVSDPGPRNNPGYVPRMHD